MASVLVLGGAGNIGSSMVLTLRDAGHRVVVVDDLSHGHRDAVPPDVPLVVGDVGDPALWDGLLAGERFDGVLHFAAHIEAGESMADPGRYFENNTATTMRLLPRLRDAGLPLVFSSTAAVYGEPQAVPIPEDHPLRPVNNYGLSKLMVEQTLAAYAAAYGFRYVALRYFNAAGADPRCRAGERHDPETHLVPIALQVASGRRAEMAIWGEDYPTEDGTCVRDYVHVADLCRAHLRALEHLWAGGGPEVLNLGAGRGTSVREVLACVEAVTGRCLAVRKAARRSGDPARLVADIAKAGAVLGWRPERSDLATIVADAWAWELRMVEAER